MLQPALGDMERSREGIRRETALAYARRSGINTIETHGASLRIGIVASGKTYLHGPAVDATQLSVERFNRGKLLEETAVL